MSKRERLRDGRFVPRESTPDGTCGGRNRDGSPCARTPETGARFCLFHVDPAKPTFRFRWNLREALAAVRTFDPFETGWVLEPTTQTYAGVILPVVTPTWDGERLTPLQHAWASRAQEAAIWLRHFGHGAEVDELLATQHARMCVKNEEAFRRFDADKVRQRIDKRNAARRIAEGRPAPEAPAPEPENDDVIWEDL